MDFEPEVLLHTLTGLMMVCSGAVAGFSRKGSTIHRYAGRAFAASAAVTVVLILFSAVLRPATVPALGVIFTVFVSYLIVTSLSVIRHPGQTVGGVEIAAPFIATAVAGFCFWYGAEAFNNPQGLKDEVPYGYYVFFGAVAALAALFDIKLLVKGGVTGYQRLMRHLWRMLFALYFATASMFTGPGNSLFPESLKSSFILTIPETIIGLLLLYWIGQTLLRSRRARHSEI